MSDTASNPIHIGMLIFPGMTQLDFTGPFEVLSRLPGATCHVLWKDREPVTSDAGLRLVPDTAFIDCPPLDVLFVPGGPGQAALMADEELLDFLRRHAGARYITSVCTGSLLLAAAGLLQGYRAACHWLSRDQLALFGIEAVDQRVVIDRNRVTGGGVTSGIDFAYVLASLLCGEHIARRIQLMLEYDPQPPFASGTPAQAGEALTQEVRRMAEPMLIARRAASADAALRLTAKHC